MGTEEPSIVNHLEMLLKKNYDDKESSKEEASVEASKPSGLTIDTNLDGKSSAVQTPKEDRPLKFRTSTQATPYKSSDIVDEYPKHDLN